MRRLNLTRDVFAGRIGVKRRALDTWLLPEGSQEFRAMPEVVNRFVTEIVENEGLLQKYAQSAQTGPLRNRIAAEGKHQLLSVDQFTRERSEEHTSELQSLMRISYAVFCLKKKNLTHHLLHIGTKSKRTKHN